MTYSIKFTEAQLKTLLKATKNYKELTYTIKRQAESILGKRKRKDDEKELRENTEKSINDKLIEITETIRHHAMYLADEISLAINIKATVALCYDSGDKLQECLKKIDEAKENERKNINDSIEDIKQFEKTIRFKDIRLKYTPLYQKIIEALMDVEKGLEISFMEKLGHLSFKSNSTEEIIEKLTEINEYIDMLTIKYVKLLEGDLEIYKKK